MHDKINSFFDLIEAFQNSVIESIEKNNSFNYADLLKDIESFKIKIRGIDKEHLKLIESKASAFINFSIMKIENKKNLISEKVVRDVILEILRVYNDAKKLDTIEKIEIIVEIQKIFFNLTKILEFRRRKI